MGGNIKAWFGFAEFRYLPIFVAWSNSLFGAWYDLELLLIIAFQLGLSGSIQLLHAPGHRPELWHQKPRKCEDPLWASAPVEAKAHEEFLWDIYQVFALALVFSKDLPVKFPFQKIVHDTALYPLQAGDLDRVQKLCNKCDRPPAWHQTATTNRRHLQLGSWSHRPG